MSFSSEIKDSLSNTDKLSDCCIHAMFYGFLLFTHFSKLNLSFTTENRNVYEFYKSVLKEYIGVDAVEADPDAKKMTAFVENSEDKIKIFEKFGHDINESNLRINRANLENDCCINAFLRGAFLSCGSVPNPNSGYHLEFVVPYKKLSSDLIKVLCDLGLDPKYLLRKGYHIVYFRDSESIEDLLAYIGAMDASLYLMNVKIEKDIKNKVNRRLNFEMSNLDKVLSASNSQVEAIRYIISEGGINLLPENLREIARIRLDNPEASLNEIGDMLTVKISKSGVKHKLDKIIEFADKMKEN